MVCLGLKRVFGRLWFGPARFLDPEGLIVSEFRRWVRSVVFEEVDYLEFGTVSRCLFLSIVGGGILRWISTFLFPLFLDKNWRKINNRKKLLPALEHF